MGSQQRSYQILEALSQASHEIVNARSPEDIYKIYGEKFAELGWHFLALECIEDPAYLELKFISINPKLVKMMERVAGVQTQGYRQPVKAGELLDQVLNERRTLFVPNLAERMLTVMPKLTLELVERVWQKMGVREAIYAPLMVGEQVYGVLAVAGLGLSEDDVPVVTILARQAAISLFNLHTQEEIRQSEVRFRSLIEQTTDSIFCYEFKTPISVNLPGDEQVERMVNCTLVECNDVWAQSYGFSHPDDVIGKELTELFGTESESLNPLFTAVVKDGYRVVDGEGTEVFADGSQRHFLNNAHGVVVGGLLYRMWGTIRDVTERVESEKLLGIQRELAIQLSGAIGMKVSLKTILESAIQASQTDCGGVYLLDEQTGDFVLQYSIGLGEEFIKSASPIVQGTPQAELLRIGDPIYSRHQELGVPVDDPRRREGRAIAIVPVLHEKRVVACLNLASHSLDDIPTHSRIAIETIGATIGSTIARLQAEDSLREAHDLLEERVAERTADLEASNLDLQSEIQMRERMENTLLQRTTDLGLINDLNNALNEGASLEEVIDVFSRETKLMYPIASGGGALIFLLDQDSQQLVSQNLPVDRDTVERVEKLIRRELPRLVIPLKPNKLHADILQSNQPIIMNELKLIDEWIREYVSEPMISSSRIRNRIKKLAPEMRSLVGIQSMIAIPLYSAGVPIGLMEIGSSREFSEEDLERLIAISQQLTAAIQRKLNEEAVRESEQRLFNFLEAIQVGVFVLQADGTPYFANQKSKELLGKGIMPEITVDELAEVYSAYISGTDELYPQSEMPIASALAGETTTVDNMEIKHPHGNLQIQVWGAPVYDTQGKVEYAIAAFGDITERKTIELALQESVEKFTRFIEQSVDGIVLTDIDGRIIEWNDSQVKITGVPRANALGKYLWEIQNTLIPDESRTPEMSNIMWGAILKTLETGTSDMLDSHMEMDFQRPDSTLRSVQIATFPIQTKDGFLLGNILRDITEQKLVETALRESETRFRTLVNAMDDIVYTLDREGRYIGIYGQWVEKLGTSPDEYLGKNEQEILGEEEASIHQLSNDRALNGENVVFEWSLANPEGRQRFIQTSLSPIYDESTGEVVQIVGVGRDITELHLAERALAKQAEELSRSNAELERFAYIASHDLQEPLRAISGFLQLLQRKFIAEIDPKAEDYINRAVNAASRMQTLIRDLLSYSRVGTRGNPFEHVDTAVIIEHVLSNLQTSIEETQANVIIDNKLPMISADATQISQLFQNLFANAMKFHGEKPPEIHVGSKRKDSYWQFYIKDNGIGIAEEYQDRIFEIFQRLHTKSEYPGTGIGLAIAKKIVERHGGRIWIELKPGKGSTFFFTLADG